MKAKLYQAHYKLHPLINIISGLWTMLLDRSPSKYMTTIYNYFCIKMIFLDFLSKKFMKICSKTHQIAPLKNFFSGALTPPRKRVA